MGSAGGELVESVVVAVVSAGGVTTSEGAGSVVVAVSVGAGSVGAGSTGAMGSAGVVTGSMEAEGSEGTEELL